MLQEREGRDGVVKLFQVRVKLHDILGDRAGLNRSGGEGFIIKKVEEGTSVDGLVAALGFERDLVGLAVVNGRQVDFALCLKDGDEVSLFSPMSGG